MTAQIEIEHIFGTSALVPPIFYNNPGGLRFKLSEGGSFIHQFLTAYRKASEICNYTLSDISEILLVAEYFGYRYQHNILSVAKSLKEIQLWLNVKKRHWFQAEEIGSDYGQHFLSYAISKTHLDSILWSNIASDLGVTPCARCRIHIFDLQNKIHVFLYDDRGMDITGPNHDALKSLYKKYRHYLLEHDIEIMNKTFENCM